MKNAVRMNERDNVAVLLEPRRSEEMCIYMDAQGTEYSISVREDIPVYHKVAICEISKGERIMKYGECIGIATETIARGEHVHVHNVGSFGMKKGEL